MTKGKCLGGGANDLNRYKRGKLFRIQINDLTVQGCPKYLVSKNPGEVSQQKVHMKWLNAIFKDFDPMPDILPSYV